MSPPPPSRPRPAGTVRIGQVAGVDILVRASWLLVAVLISVMVAPRIELVTPGLGSLVYVAGLAFAVLLYLSVLLHEISHALMAKFFGFEVRSVTLHFLGGVTEIEGESDTAWREFWIAVVGPLTSLAVAAGAYGLSLVLSGDLLLLAVESLALANLVVGVLNLLPGMPLDGGRVLRALVWGATGKPVLGLTVSGWAGRVLAVAALTYPVLWLPLAGLRANVLDWVLAGVVAFFLWSGATQALLSARLRRRLPALRAREIARRVATVPADATVAAAVERARAEQAAGVVVLDVHGRPVAVVDEQAVEAMPEDRRPHVGVQTVARTLGDGHVLPADAEGEPMVRAMQASPADAYVLVAPDGSVWGLLASVDVDRAFARA